MVTKQQPGDSAKAKSMDRMLAIAFGAIVLILMLTSVGTASYFFVSLNSQEEDRLVGIIARILDQSINKVAFSGKYQTRLLVEEMKATVPDLKYISVESEDGTVIAHSDPALNGTMFAPEGPSPLTHTGVPVVSERTIEGRSVKEVAIPYRGGMGDRTLGIIRIGVDVNASHKAQRRNLVWAIILAGALTAIAMWLVLLLSRRFGGTFRTMAVQLQGIAANLPGIVYQFYAMCAGGYGMNYISERAGEVFELDNNIHTFFDEFAEHVHPDDRNAFMSSIQKAVATVSPWRYEGRFVKSSGDILWFSGVSEPVELPDRIVFNGLLLDITDRKRADEERERLQSQLSQAQKMESIGQLAGGIAHDFNNMLGGIMASAELLQDASNSERDRDEYLRMIIDSAERAAELTNKLLTFARKQPASYSVINILHPLRDAMSLLMNTADKRIAMHASLPEAEVPVKGDPAQLQSMFLNLLINATHAMPDGGDIFVTARRLDLDAAYCQARGQNLAPGPFVEVEIRDTGCGIPQENLARIFEPFFTTKERGKGTGLGLAVVHGTVRQHKGIVTVYSEVGTGTCFHVLLPLASTGVDTTPKTKTPESPVRGSGTILLVDDEAVMRATGSAILEGLGYEVLLAENGKQALASFQREADRIDLVILDMVMPEMNGRDCFFAMKRIRPAVRVILASGFSQEEEVESMKAAGLLGFVRKPYRSTVLSQAVSQAMRATVS